MLLEICFVDSQADADLYRETFNQICENLAYTLSGTDEEITEPPLADEASFHAIGRCSYFGGPEDFGVSEDEGLAFHYDITPANQHLFLPIDDGTGLARRLNPWVSYLACRWDYDVTPKDMLANSGQLALVKATKTGIALTAIPADWGPHGDTKRVADLSPGLMAALGIETDDEVEVTYPWND